MKITKKNHAANYCLRCHRDIEANRERSRRCSGCGFNNLGSDHKKFWSLSPKLIDVKRKVRNLAGIWFVLAIPAVLILVVTDVEVVNPILLALFTPFLLWYSSERMLRKGGAPVALLWAIYFGVLAYCGYLQMESFEQANPWESWVFAHVVFDGVLSILALTSWFLLPKWREYQVARYLDQGVIESFDAVRSLTSRVSANYCLKCFHEMPASHGRCGACQFNNLPTDRRIYWNKNPKIQGFEYLGKFLAVAAGCGLTAISIFGLTHSGVGSGWAIGMNFVLVYVMWMTLGKLTRHMSNFEPSIVWCSAFTINAALMSPFLLAKGSNGFLIGAFSVGVGISAVLLTMLVTAIFVSWKKKLQRSGGKANYYSLQSPVS